MTRNSMNKLKNNYDNFEKMKTMTNNNINEIKKAMAIITRVVALVMIAIAFLIVFSFSAHAATTGRIFGRLLDGTNKNAPIAGQTLTLQMAQGDTAKDLANVTTDAHGSFLFNNLPTDKTISYSLYIRYQGAQYNSDIITLD